MATITLLKEKGVYSYFDFTVPRAALRLDELQSDNVMAIARDDNSTVVAYLISAAWYTGQLAIMATNHQTAPTVSISTYTDDYLGGNLSTLVNLVNGTPEVVSQQARFNAEGTTFTAYKMFAFVHTQEFWEDPSFAQMEQMVGKGDKYSPDNTVIPGGPIVPDVQNPDQNIGGAGGQSGPYALGIMGYLVSPALYTILAAG
jgi:hypothetical protein